MFRLHWSEAILSEVTRNLVVDEMTTEAGAQRLAETFRNVLADAQVSGFEHLIDGMTNDPKDRHVVATAVQAGAQLIVTENLAHFPPHALECHGITACSTDTFLVDLYDRHGDLMAEIVIVQASVLRNPPLTVAQVLDNLTRDGASVFAGRVRTQLNLPGPKG